MNKGKLIVIEGGDGSGKTVQAKLLVEYFKKKGKSVEYIEYPRYTKSFYGAFVSRFLSGEFGKLDEVSPYLAAIPYALDRLDQRDEILSWLSSGKIIIANRYTTSSIAHQASKVKLSERKKIIHWIEEMEYIENKMPKPDLVIYLYVPWKIGVQLSSKQNPKINTFQRMDIAEKDENHRIQTEKVYQMLASSGSIWKRIDCVKNNKLLSIGEINKKVIQVIDIK